MKNFLLILLYFINNVLVLSAQGTPGKWGDQGNGTYINPILNADYSDPDVIRVRDKYYMIASDFHFLGMQVLESSDMINWKLISQIYHHFDFPGWDNNQQYAGGSWAPSIRYHDNKFWVFFCTPKEGLFMSNAVNPSGPWSPLHLVKKVEKWEDPCPFWDEDGQAYLGRSRHGAGPIIIHKMSADGTRLLDEGMTVYTGPVAEGTKIFKKDGYYYLSIPEGGVGTGWQTILRSKNIYGPYEKKVVLEQGSTTINGPHQGAIVDTPDDQWAFFHFQHHHALGRVVHLQPMHWENDWPVIGVDFDRNGIGEPVYVCQKPIESKTIFAPQTDDDFSTPNLSLQWQFNHNPTDHAWSLSAHPGSLTLKALKSSTFRLARNTLTQKIMGNISEATIAMDFTEIADGQRCGLACMGKINNVLGIKMEKGQKYLYTSNDTTEISTTFPNGNQIYLRVSIDMTNQKFQYFYSTDNIRFIPYGTSFFIPFGFWKGARIALYCYNKEQEAGTASFQWFIYKHDGPQNKIDNAAEQIISNIARTSFPHKKIKVICPDSASNQKGHSRQLIQRAIDSCSLAGGGHVIISKGIYYLKGNLVLKSDVNLHLEKDAYLLFSGKADDFLPEVWTRWEGTELYGHSPMIYAKHATNIAITGQGTIDAQGGREFASWSQIEVSDRNRLRKMGEKLIPVTERIFGKGTILRPSCIQFMGCSRILVEGITIKNSPFWTIDADGREIGRPSKNIVIRNCLFQSECNGLCIGSEMSGGVENVYMDNIQIGTVKNALYFKSNRDRGGYIRNIQVSNITIERSKGAILRFETNYFGFRGGRHASQYENFRISNVKADCSDHYAIFMDGYEEKPIRNIEIEHFHVRKAAYPYYLKCAENIRLKDTSVNGRNLPEYPEKHKKRVTLDIY